MITATTDTLTRAADFVWRNARLLDRRRFAFFFEDGRKEAVAAALRPYQNADGGFGNALEADMRCPDSQPCAIELALRIVDEVDGFDDSMVAAVCDFLPSITTPEGGVPSVLPSVAKYPAAPWWLEIDSVKASLNPTAGIAGLLLKHGVRHRWLEQAVDYCWRAITTSRTTSYHDLIPMITFLEYAPDRRRAERELRVIAVRIMGSDAVAYDPDAEGYVKGPLDWAPSPASYGRRLFNEEIIDRHLGALAARQQADGGWPINWQPLSPACELEWRGWVTVEALRTLRAYAKV